MYTTTSVSINIKNYYKYTTYITYYRQWFNTCTKDTIFQLINEYRSSSKALYHGVDYSKTTFN